MKKIYKIIDINIEKIWGLKKIEHKIIGEVIKFEINEKQSNDIVDNQGNIYNLYELYSGKHRKYFFGKHFLNREVVPFMIKYIYSNKKLSLQVHPKEKKETLLFLKDNSKIILGLKNDMRQNQINVDSLLINSNVVNCNKYDFAVVEPGIIHSILENNFVCEIQNNYDVTYRYYDWDNNRSLTTKEFVENANFNKYNLKKNILHNFKKYNSLNFSIKKFSIKKMKKFYKKSDFQILIILDGYGIINTSNESLEVKKDETYFILPKLNYTIFGNLDVLVVS